MQVHCASCGRTLPFSGERPKFCPFCGQPVPAPAAAGPAPSEAATAALSSPPPESVPAPVGAESEGVTAAPLPDTWATQPVPEGLSDVARDGITASVGGYKLLRKLGGGGMGAVYEAEEASSGRRVALKLVLPEYAKSSEAVRRFRQEGMLASTLAHPRCVFVLAVDEDAGRPYIVMELMPGSTLDDLVKKRGPLPIEEALTKIIDVIDGLSEAHRLGLVHRDVKPSNCFLESESRVKIGDFGLARSLVSDTKLTRTGTFLGTPLYASPEQVKSEKVDAQSDVYSVAATLYFLLTGKAPFQSGDSMATLAKIVSEDPPPMRTLRPEIAKGLDKVVLRGLERDRKRRWKSLDDFRAALVPFLPARPSVGGMGLRFVAYLLDSLLLAAIGTAVGFGVMAPLKWSGVLPTLSIVREELFYNQPLGLLLSLAYFSLLEGVWGASPGKRLLRLRVGSARDNGPPGVPRAAARYAVLWFLMSFAHISSAVALILSGLPDPMTPQDIAGRPEVPLVLGLIGCGQVVIVGAAIAAIVLPMRLRNGFRGLHEFASGTRTYRLHWPQPPKRQTLQRRDFELEVTQPAGLPERVGAFRVLGALRWTDAEKTLLAEDAQLGRRLWIWLRPADQAPLDTSRRDISRATRLRWVGTGTHGPWQWDAFLAPLGMPLPVLAARKPRLTWAEVRPILEDLTEELAAACADGTLPKSLSVHQVWVQADGRMQLLGTPLHGSDSVVAGAPEADGDDEAIDEERALDFLQRVAVTALEGAERRADALPGRARAPVPVHVEPMLEHLAGTGDSYGRLVDWKRDLEETRDRPTEVSRWRRAGHLALMTLLLHLPISGPTFVTALSLLGLIRSWNDLRRGQAGGDVLGMLVLVVMHLVAWVAWDFVFRGGYSYWRGGIVLRRADGRKPARWQCAYRTLLAWGPVFGLFGTALLVGFTFPGLLYVYGALWVCGVLLLPVYAVFAIKNPRQALHDRIAGTYLMPE